MYYTRLDLPFTDIFVIENVVCICTRRPGWWIGKAGCIINEISKKLNFNLKGEKIHNFKIKLLETTKGAVVDVYDYIKVFGNY